MDHATRPVLPPLTGPVRTTRWWLGVAALSLPLLSAANVPSGASNDSLRAAQRSLATVAASRVHQARPSDAAHPDPLHAGAVNESGPRSAPAMGKRLAEVADAGVAATALTESQPYSRDVYPSQSAEDTETSPLMAAVPEPQGYTLLLAGVCAVLFIARRRGRD